VTWEPPAVRGGALARWGALLGGLALFSVGIVLLLEARLGLTPWDVLSQGIARTTPLGFGIANTAVALCVLVLAWALGARVGPGTVANAVGIGVFVQLLVDLRAFGAIHSWGLAPRALVLVGGIVLIGLASALYIGAWLGAGPRDSLMLELSRRTRARVGLVRTVIEATVTVLGFLLGGKVGIGTFAFAVGIGPAVESSFWLLGSSPLGSTQSG
jgi:uncharacterized protein